MNLFLLRRFVLTAALLSVTACLAETAGVRDSVDLDALHVQVGQTLDRRYYEAGRRVDMAIFDFEELERQGKPVDTFLVNRVNGIDKHLRAGWQELENRRKLSQSRLAELPPECDHVFALEDLSRDGGNAGWVGVHSVKIVWKSGASVDLPLASFTNASVRRGYTHNLDRPTDAIFAYGKPSPRSTLQAGFSAPKNASGEATLVIVGLDDDKPGITRIKVSIDGKVIFEGANTFRDNTFTEVSFPIPADTMTGAAPRSEAVGKLQSEMNRLLADIEAFGNQADKRAAEVETETAAVRKGLVWKPLNIPNDWWKREFIRGICYVPFEQEMTHHFRSFRQANANFLYSYAGHYNESTVFPATMEAVKDVGLPYAQFAGDLRRRENNRLMIGDPKSVIELYRNFRREVMGNSGVHINLAVDEPKFDDKLAEDLLVIRDFRAWLKNRSRELAEAGISVPVDAKPVVTIEKPEDRPLWMEWQMFKCHSLADHLRALWDGLAKDKAFPFVITQDLLGWYPQAASHVTIGQALPMLSNDLYSNGSVREAFVIDLQRNVSRNRTILTAGAGYSCKTPSRFRRSMVTGMAHSDGVLQWTDIYLTKYRDWRAFWKGPNDDQGRPMLANWDPGYWDLTRTEFARMANADRWLTGITSTATNAVLFSERTSISDMAGDGNPYVNNTLALYSDLLRRGKPLDARFVETLPGDALSRYRVMVLADARVLTTGECNILREWVRNGGVLIATADTSLCDEWGREQKDFSLADVFGASYDKQNGIKVVSATVLDRRPDGSPSLTSNDFGKGRCYLFADKRLGARTALGIPGSALYGEGRPEVARLLSTLVDSASGESPVSLVSPPDGVEFQVYHKGKAWIVHLVDWIDDRTLSGIRIKVNLPGKWRVKYPTDGTPGEIVWQTVNVRPFSVHEMLVIEPA